MFSSIFTEILNIPNAHSFPSYIIFEIEDIIDSLSEQKV